ncbi:MAG: creatininase family protein [Alphaproteobacteria bacterium]|nr:creatininase family protein [Alphaproteobacteria bacterium]NNF25120.1 creatininase family protein [Paracoccaceae bacterium]
MFDNILNQTTASWLAILLPSQRIFYLYLLSALCIAALTYFWFSAAEENNRPDAVKKGLLGYLFDPKIWWHKSARQDYVFFFVNGLIYYGLVSQLMLGAHAFYGLFGVWLDGLFGLREAPLFEASALTVALYTLAVVLAIDLAVYVTHYLQHKVMVLWQFHQVHHSAEVLTPATVYRMHPVDLFFTGIISAVLIGLAFAGFVYLTGAAPSEMTVLNVNIVIFSFYLIGYNLRHSHIWLSYPPWLSYIFISPAQHQTHHSIDEKHYDRNFGLVFAFWDWLFGTLYVPHGYEKLEFGVAREEPNPFKNVTDIYIKPFKGAWALLAPQGKLRPGPVLGALGVLALGAFALTQYSAQPVSARQGAAQSVHLQDLTWTEVAAAQAEGFDTVIIPTGGTEQNGPHVILGKHNYIVEAAAEDVARRLGGTLVAPVMAYVPEGAAGDRPTGHMRWTGTLSLPEPLFQQVLEETARSLETHGFHTILLMGDSLGNQDAQAAVAARLGAEWRARGVRVIHLGDYYSANGQEDWLRSRGYDAAEIGGHAGIRDTSELLSVHPGGVRAAPLDPPRGADPGYSGAPSRATASIGAEMLLLKIEAALAQLAALGITSGLRAEGVGAAPDLVAGN